MHEDIAALGKQLNDAEQEARAVTAGLSEQDGQWRRSPDSWSVAQCLGHLAIANRTYVKAMRPAAKRAAARRGPATPGPIGRWFVRTLEPPVKSRMKSPRSIRPQEGPTLASALAEFLDSQSEVRKFLGEVAELDLAGTRFANPFIKVLRFSLATGLNVILAHERRHLWQAAQVRKSAPGIDRTTR